MKPHHTSGDWDFANANWILDNAVFVSAPSSLHFLANLNNCKLKPTTVPIANMKEGRIITYVRFSLQVHTEIIFRWQDDNNYYVVVLGCSQIGFPRNTTVYRRKAAANTLLRQANVIWTPLNTFARVRITWWNDFVGLVIRVEYWDGANWVQFFADAFDAQNNWKDIGGRIGLGDFALTNAASFLWFDDTFIYGIPP